MISRDEKVVMRWSTFTWAALPCDHLYDALQLRQLVFSVEQQCAYLDCDGLDRAAVHLLGRGPTGDLLAYARLFRRGIKYAERSIGRVVTHPSVRRTGLGRALMRQAIAELDALDVGTIRIGAQKYLVAFYGGFGFKPVGPDYDEDGIPHVEMVKTG